MVKLFLSIEADQPFPQLLSWLDLLHTLEPIRLTAAVTQESIKEDAACRSGCRRLERFCLEKGIRLKIISGSAAPALPEPDLVLLDAARRPDAAPRPALLLPEGAALPAELILLYDGSEASKIAIRQFAELFPAFTWLPANLLCIRDDAGSPIPDEAAIRALGASLYHKFRLVSIHRRSAGFFEAWLGMMTSPWIVSAKTFIDGRAASPQPHLAAELIRIRPMAAFAA
ncbi:MAG TPA: hypothetical protein VMH27_23125 [Puia sp.]|nr:hypothetical protein [Puia sp.]